MKIIYCFLTYQHITRIDLWNTYFRNQSTNDYSVYIHPKNTFDTSYYDFPIHIINHRIETKSKTDISIVRATLQLFREAYENELEGTHFIFLTQSCMPLYTFEEHKTILSKISQSFISCIQGNKINRYSSLSPLLKGYIPSHFFYKQQPNMILIREDVEWFIQNDYTKYFERMECPDEHYFINIMIYLYRKKFIKQQTHFCNTILSRTQAIHFPYISKELIIKCKCYGFLFLRKVSENTIICV